MPNAVPDQLQYELVTDMHASPLSFARRSPALRRACTQARVIGRGTAIPSQTLPNGPSPATVMLAVVNC
jgi:hypothetical protein